MRSSSILSSLLITAFSLAVFTTPAFSQSPFPVPGPASLPLDEGRDVLLRSCNLCHPIMAMLGQQRTEPEWKGVVDAMRGRGAVVTDQEAALIAGYLAKNFAPGMPVRPGAGRMPGARSSSVAARPMPSPWWAVRSRRVIRLAQTRSPRSSDKRARQPSAPVRQWKPPWWREV